MTQSDPTRTDSIKTLAAMIKEVHFAMLTVQTADGHLHAHPMTTQQVEFDGDIWFIGGKDTEQVQNMAARPQVNVSYSSPDKGVYVSVNGTAQLVENRAKLDELWSDFYQTYFPQGKEDPNIQLIQVHANGAEYWEGNGKIRSLLEFARGLVGGKPDMGENETVRL